MSQVGTATCCFARYANTVWIQHGHYWSNLLIISVSLLYLVYTNYLKSILRVGAAFGMAVNV